MCNNGPCLNDDVEEDNQLTQYVDVQVPLETQIVSAEGQIDEVQAVIDQNVNVLIGPSGAQSLSGLSASLGHCNLLEPPKDVILIEDDVVILDIKRERCELVEKFSSPQRGTVCVQGYKVKRSVAKTLEAIFKEHGDIAAECVCKTDTFRSSILETVCEDAQLIQNNDFNGKQEDIERRVLDAKAVNINVSWLQAHLEAIRKRKEAREEYNLLMEMKANNLMAKKAAEINLRKRRAELAVVQERSKEAKRSVEVAHLVGRNLIDSFFKCRAETDMWAKAAVV
ncbi:hypothetical protein M8C21_016307 [Ambrosia artemisiifolia]|uniref:Uncharacterized protein n=1 Tax=Ambrosia artemisiifolia TaxID=4212 RepID=A0AAD5CT74_AMBAR|nr:hypothetical protein M8C21_016307 [Ambrosia artemisiifolia]